MNRRKFLMRGGASALLLSSGSFLSKSCMLSAKEDGMKVKEIKEKSRIIPVIKNADVIVCGGGPSGIGAALEAARSGARTVLIEQSGFLGGTWTAGLLGVVLDHRNRGGLLQELKDILTERKWRLTSVDTGYLFTFDVERMKLLLDELCEKANVEVMLYTSIVSSVVENNRLTHVITESKSGRQAIQGKVFIDATGDGDLAALSGCGYDFGNEEGVTQPTSMLGLLTGIKFSEVQDYALWSGRKPRVSKKNLVEQIRKGGYSPTYENPCLFMVNEDVYSLMATHQYNVNSISQEDLTKASVIGRKEIHQIVDALHSLGGPWENVKLLTTSTQIGVREARRIHGLYTITEQDLVEGKRHEDAACEVTFGVDVHPLHKSHEQGSYSRGVKSKPYDIPLKSLIAKDVEGLMMVGRCISGDFIAHSSYRVNGNSVILGQAAGRVAAESLKLNKPLREIHFHYRQLM